jgi:hypothetical protein
MPKIQIQSNNILSKFYFKKIIKNRTFIINKMSVKESPALIGFLALIIIGCTYTCLVHDYR